VSRALQRQREGQDCSSPIRIRLQSAHARGLFSKALREHHCRQVEERLLNLQARLVSDLVQ
jgi:hypothetical protein